MKCAPQLERVIASPEFSASERDRKFLRYVVEETLAGRADRIKGYSIGTEVFGRDASFDAQSDPVVRIEAGRLRRALERYYLLDGSADPVRIDIPKGAYVPTFTRWAGPSVETLATIEQASPTPSPAAPAAREGLPEGLIEEPKRKWIVGLGGGLCALLLFGVAYGVSGHFTSQPPPAPPTGIAPLPLPSRPSVIVVPFADLGETPASRLYAIGLTEEVLSQLARFTELTVLGRDTSNSLAPSADAGPLRRALGFRYALEGSVRTSNGRLRVTARLLDAEVGAVLWSQAYDENLEARDFLAVQSDVAQKVATAVGQPYGALFRADERRSRPPEDPEAYACTSQYYNYRAVRGPERHAALRNCMERTVARFPGYATALAMLSFLYLDEDRFGFNVRPGALGRAIETARRAISLNPEDVRALQALMMSLSLSREHDEALRVGEKALAVNPNDMELMGEVGSRMCLAGNWQRGAALVERARAMNPAQAGYYNGTLALCAYLDGNYPSAAGFIRQTSSERYPFYHLVAAITYAQLGWQKEADEARALFARERPDFENNWHAELAKRAARADDRAHLEQGGRKAGFSIPPEPGARPALLQR